MTTPERIVFAAGDIFGGGGAALISVLYLFYLTDVIGIPPGYAGLALLIPKIWDAINDPLSLRRAEATRNYLTAKGVSGARINVQGMGSHQPVASNATNEGRARNRRVEIFVGERPRG